MILRDNGIQLYVTEYSFDEAHRIPLNFNCIMLVSVFNVFPFIILLNRLYFYLPKAFYTFIHLSLIFVMRKLCFFSFKFPFSFFL